MNKITLSEVEQYLWGAANLLRGPIDNADFKAYIFPLLFFKRISDIYDEEYKQALEDSLGEGSLDTMKIESDLHLKQMNDLSSSLYKNIINNFK